MKEIPVVTHLPVEGITIFAHKSGLYQGFQKASLVDLCKDEDVTLVFIYPVGTYVIAGTPLLSVSQKKDISNKFKEKLSTIIDIERGQDINTSYYYGFKQLVEIAIKALSPGINDPGTAIIALQALGDLLRYRLANFPAPYFSDEEEIVRVVTVEKTFEEMFEEYILPIWDYGKSDRLMQKEMIHILTMLQVTGERPEISNLFKKVQRTLKSAI